MQMKILVGFLALVCLPFIGLAQGAKPTPKPLSTPTPQVVKSSDDNDGDGVKNSDDACPGDKGTKANRGCPSDDEEMTAEEAKRQKEKLDSLKSNIDIFAPPTPKPSAAPKPSPTTNSDKELEELMGNIILGKVPAGEKTPVAPPPAAADCKYILEFEKCRNVLFAMTSSEVLKAFGQTEGKQFGMVTQYAYKGLIIDVANTGRVEEVEFKGYSMLDFNFKSPYTERTPAADISWGSGKDKIVKRFGKPQSETKMKGVDGQKVEFLFYDNNHMSFDFEKGKLVKITVKRKISDDEYAQMRKNYQQQQAEIEARKTPAERARDRAREIQVLFDDLHESLDSLMNQANAKVRMYSVTDYGRRAAQEKEVAAILSLARERIESFLKTHAGKLPQNVIDHLNEDLEKFSSGRGH